MLINLPVRDPSSFSRMHIRGKPAVQVPRELIPTNDTNAMQPTPNRAGEPWMLGLGSPAASISPIPASIISPGYPQASSSKALASS
ncbi:hypothetical protein NGA_0455900, partial [Nannochloropsis gaditana CCMP526]|uniref:uncharacterized protein n=1 Tax=Nannochloropsis gaditana (strain CCMP526) TaxID=1093141 RepID=UPI00029F78A6